MNWVVYLFVYIFQQPGKHLSIDTRFVELSLGKDLPAIHVAWFSAASSAC